MNSCLCLDYDGVLADTLTLWASVVVFAQANLGLGRVPTLEDLRRVPDLSNRGFADYIRIPSQDFARWEAALKQGLSSIKYVSYFPGAVEFVQQIPKSSQICIVTSNFKSEVEKTLIEHRLYDRIARIFGSEESGDKKDKLERACSYCNAEPSQSVFVGDSGSDIRHGRNAGMKTIAVTWGFQVREILLQEHPHMLVENFPQLSRAIHALMG